MTMATSLTSSPPPSYFVLHQATNPVNQYSLHHAVGSNAIPRQNPLRNPLTSEVMSSAKGESGLDMSSNSNSFYSFNPSDSSIRRERQPECGDRAGPEWLPTSRAHCPHPVCSWWRWRRGEEVALFTSKIKSLICFIGKTRNSFFGNCKHSFS